MRLIRGASGSGKTALVFREFGDAVRKGLPGLRIVVPTATLVRHYQHELARTGLVFDPGLVVSLSRFARDCAGGLAIVPAGLERALVREALARLQLPEFVEVASTPGMADVVTETISLFENADCTPERLARVRGLSAHARAFLRIWQELDSAMAARGFATRGQVIRRASAATFAGTVWMDGFLKFSPLERGLVRAVARSCDLTLTLTDGRITDDTRRFAMELGAADRLLPGAARSPGTIAVEAPSPEREADEIARRIVELQARGTAFPDIAVALRDVDTWLPLLRTTFDRFGIPARYYFSIPFRKHPVAVFLGGLISCALSGWEFEPTLTALRAHPGWGHSADFDRFDFRVREAMPGRGAEALAGWCESDWLRARIADCLSIDPWRNERARPDVWRRRLEQFADKLYRIRTVAEPADYAAIDSARSHAAGLRAWASALDTAANYWTDDAPPVSLEEFHAVVSDELASSGMHVPDDRHNVIHVMSAFEARQWEVRTMFVCGLTARDYPRHQAQNLLFADGEIERLRGAGIPLRTAVDEDRDEDLLFEALRTRATDSLVLTVSARDSGGQTILPSRHFSEARTSGKGTRVKVCRPAPQNAPAAAGADGVIQEAALPGLAEQHRTVSLTALEDLAKCRFRFFAGKSLGLKGVPDRPSERLQPRVTGLIFHEAMEDWLTDRTRDFVELFEHAFDEACRKRHIPPGYRVEVERIQLRRIAREVSETAQWPVMFSEAEVDCSLDFPGGVTVNCRVDRIDHVGEGNCVIVDYKSGKTANVDKLVQSETSLQGPLYALAVREKKQLNPVAMVFLAIREGRPIGWGEIPGSGLELTPMPPGWIDDARSRTVARLQSFLAGDVHVQPTSLDDCKWCDFSKACRIETQEPEQQLVKIGVVGGD